MWVGFENLVKRGKVAIPTNTVRKIKLYIL